MSDQFTTIQLKTRVGRSASDLKLYVRAKTISGSASYTLDDAEQSCNWFEIVQAVSMDSDSVGEKSIITNSSEYTLIRYLAGDTPPYPQLSELTKTLSYNESTDIIHDGNSSQYYGYIYITPQPKINNTPVELTTEWQPISSEFGEWNIKSSDKFTVQYCFSSATPAVGVEVLEITSTDETIHSQIRHYKALDAIELQRGEALVDTENDELRISTADNSTANNVPIILGKSRNELSQDSEKTITLKHIEGKDNVTSEHTIKSGDGHIKLDLNETDLAISYTKYTNNLKLEPTTDGSGYEVAGIIGECSSRVVMPAEFEGKSVKGIGENAFSEGTMPKVIELHASQLHSSVGNIPKTISLEITGDFDTEIDLSELSLFASVSFKTCPAKVRGRYTGNGRSVHNNIKYISIGDNQYGIAAGTSDNSALARRTELHKSVQLISEDIVINPSAPAGYLYHPTHEYPIDSVETINGIRTTLDEASTYTWAPWISEEGNGRTSDFFAMISTSNTDEESRTWEIRYTNDYQEVTNTLSWSKDGQLTTNTFNALSDARLKENFQSLTPEKSILDLPTYKFDFINGAKNQIGCKAQDLQEICPEIVNEGNDGYLSIQESKIVYLLLEEVKKLRKEIDELNERLL